jgi:hypothetical protein
MHPARLPTLTPRREISGSNFLLARSPRFSVTKRIGVFRVIGL